MEVGAADAGLVDLHQHVVGADRGDRLVAHPEAGLGLLLDEGFHAAHSRIQTDPERLPRVREGRDGEVDVLPRVSAADIWVRMRAAPFGTTGKKKPAT